MEQLIELLRQIEELAGVAIEALQGAGGEGAAPAGGGEGAMPAEGGGAPAGAPAEAPPQ